MNKTQEKQTFNFFNAVFYFLVIINLLAFVAPVLAHIGLVTPAKAVYTLYSFFCHQFHWRSIHVFDYQVAWCTRDTFIWGAMLAVAFITKKYKFKPIHLTYILLFVIPIARDGGIQTIATIFGFASADPLYISTNMMRMLTGSLFGIGLGLWMMPTLYDMWLEENNIEDKRLMVSKKKIIAVLMFFLVTFYLLLVQIWRITSPNYPPANFLDLQVKTPAYTDEWMERRVDGL